MVVEPERLCWMTGRMAGARDGVTWAGEFARLPALKAVVRDDGTGPGKGVRLDNARRREAGLPLLFDEGSGCVVDLQRYGLARQETVREALEAGVDVVTCSTDKLIGAIVLDHFGMLGLTRQPVSTEKLAGVALVLFGAYTADLREFGADIGVTTNLDTLFSLSRIALHRLTGGNPSFLTEVLGAEGDEVPASVGDGWAQYSLA